MSEVPYNYTISVAFDQGLNITLLQSQVIAAALAQPYIRIDTNADTLSIIFGGTLSAGNITTLNNVVANHIGYANGYIEDGSANGYILDVHNSLATGGGRGLRIRAGETLGDISFHIANHNNTFQIMEMETDIGYITMGKTYAQTLIDNGVVYGLDIEHTTGAVDFNTQHGIYRIGGVNVVNVAQALTNKTITDTTNNVSARGLVTTTGTVNVGSAAAPTTGQVLMATSGTAATWQSSPFSSFFQAVSIDAATTTTSTTYQLRLNLTTSSLPSGTYRIGWMYEWTCNVAATSYSGRVQINNTTTIMDHLEMPQDIAGTQWHQVSGYYNATSMSGIQSIDLDYATTTSGNTVGIRRARLDIFRVA